MDPAKKRAVFIGWPDNVSAEDLLEVTSKFMKANSKFSGCRFGMHLHRASWEQKIDEHSLGRIYFGRYGANILQKGE